MKWKSHGISQNGPSTAEKEFAWRPSARVLDDATICLLSRWHERLDRDHFRAKQREGRGSSIRCLAKSWVDKK